MSSCGEVVASPPRRRGSQVRAPWYHGGHGAVDTVGLVAYPVARGAVGTQECTQIGENGLSEPFRGICVHCCTRELCWVARAPQPPWCVGGAPLGGRLSLGWENGLCVSTAAARLASSPRQQPTQTPDFGYIRTSAASSDVPGPSRGPSGCPRRRRLTGPASTSARCIPGSVSAGQGCLPRLLAIGLSGPTRASSLSPGHHGARLVEEAGPPRAPGPALPPGPCEARLPAQRPSVPTVPSWHRGSPPTAGMSHPPMFYARPGAG